MVLEARSDGIFIFENARCSKILQRQSSSSFSPTAANLSEINRCIARDLLGCCLLPSSPWDPRNKSPSRDSSGQSSRLKTHRNAHWPTTEQLDGDATMALRCPLWDVLAAAAPHPAFKLLTCRYLPQGLMGESNSLRLAPYTFESLMRRLERMFVRADTLDLLAPPSPSTPSGYRKAHYAATQQNSRDSTEHGNATEDIHQTVAVGAQVCMRGPSVLSIEGDPTPASKISLWPYALSPVQVRKPLSLSFSD